MSAPLEACPGPDPGVEEPLSASANPFRYTGRRLDPQTGLYHYRARYYDAEWGRFLETDPVLYADQMNLYAYVGNDPLNATDPTGMCPLCPSFSLLRPPPFRPGADHAGPTFTVSLTAGGEVVGGNVGAVRTQALSTEITFMPFPTITNLGGFTETATNSDPFYPRGQLAGASLDLDIIGLELALGSIADQAGWASSLQVDAGVPGGTFVIPERGLFRPGTSLEVSAGVGGGIVGAETRTNVFTLFPSQGDNRARGVHEVSGRLESRNLSECGERRCD